MGTKVCRPELEARALVYGASGNTDVKMAAQRAKMAALNVFEGFHLTGLSIWAEDCTQEFLVLDQECCHTGVFAERKQWNVVLYCHCHAL